MDAPLGEGPQTLLGSDLQADASQRSRFIQPGAVDVFEGYPEPGQSMRDVRIRAANKQSPRCLGDGTHPICIDGVSGLSHLDLACLLQQLGLLCSTWTKGT